MIFRFLVHLFILFLGSVLWASSDGAGAHEEAHISPEVIDLLIAQAVNFAICLSLLVFLTKNAVRALFQKRHEDYHSLLRKAETNLKNVEATKTKISERLAVLESSSSSDLIRVKAEALEMKGQIVKEAKVLAEKLEREAHQTIKFEFQKAKSNLRNDLLAQSMNLAEENLKSKVSASEQKRLQNEFIGKIQVVAQ